MLSAWILSLFCVAPDPVVFDQIVAKSKPLPVEEISVGIFRDGAAVFNKEYGAGTKSPGNKRYRIGSLTKQFTAGLILQLQREGKLNINEPASKYLPDLPMSWSSITLVQLLQHTSGILDYTQSPRFPGVYQNRVEPDGIWKFVSRDKLLFQPGTQFSYSNTGYAILGRVAEVVAKKPYFDQLKSRFFRPLGMSSSGPESEIKPIQGFTGDGGKCEPLDMSWPYSAGALVSTVNDLAKWDQALRGDKLFKSEEKQWLWKPSEVSQQQDQSYGLGWIVQNKRNSLVFTGHGGGINGFVSFIGRSMVKGTTVIVLSNQEESGVASIATQMLSVAEPEFAKVVEPELAIDGRPEETRAHRAILESILNSTITEAAFSPEFLAKVPLQAILASSANLNKLGLLSRFALLKEDSNARTYLVVLGESKLQFSISEDASGQIIGMLIR